MVDIFLLLFFCSGLILIIGLGFYLMFWQEIYDYQKEINRYLRFRKLHFLKKWKPSDIDWKESPFDKPSNWSVGILTFSILGMRTSGSKLNGYWIIETKDGRRIWLEVKTAFGQKPILEFRKEKDPPPLRTKAELINQKTYECPACSYIVLEGEKECLDCGLNLS